MYEEQCRPPLCGDDGQEKLSSSDRLRVPEALAGAGPAPLSRSACLGRMGWQRYRCKRPMLSIRMLRACQLLAALAGPSSCSLQLW